MRTADYCAAVKRRLQITSDYELAKRLGVAKQTVSNYVNGHRVFDNTLAVRVAELLELEPLRVIADCELERGSNDALWKRVRGTTAMLLLSFLVKYLVGFAFIDSAHASRFNNNGIAERSPREANATEIHIASLRRRRERGRVLARFIAWLATCGALSFSL